MHPIKKSQREKKIEKIVDPLTINQLFYKKYIQSEIEAEEQKKELKKTRQTKSEPKMKDIDELIRKTTTFSKASSHTNFAKTIRLTSEENPSSKSEKK